METTALFLFFALAALDWRAVRQKHKEIEYVAKPAALAALIVYAATGPAASPLLIAALCLGLLGDVYLMLPVDLFMAGLAAFLVGHLAYIGLFDASTSWRLFWFVFLVLVTLPVSGRVVTAVKDTRLRAAVVVYLTVIIFMAASAFAAGEKMAALGAALFVASDAIIAWDRFVQPLPWARVAIIITYHLGQFGLVYALRV